jgi:hypothetical protein
MANLRRNEQIQLDTIRNEVYAELARRRMRPIPGWEGSFDDERLMHHAAGNSTGGVEGSPRPISAWSTDSQAVHSFTTERWFQSLPPNPRSACAI